MRGLTMLAAVAIVAGTGCTSSTAQSSNANLVALTISSGTLTPVFSTAVTEYTVDVPNGTSSMIVTATAADPGATIRVNSAVVSSGIGSPAIALTQGVNLIGVVVFAEDGTVRIYNITVTRA